MTAFVIPALTSQSASSSFFHLRDVQLNTSTKSIPRLPPVEPCFNLPRLPEDGWGDDTVSDGVREGLGAETGAYSYPARVPSIARRDVKGKGRAEVDMVRNGIWNVDLSDPHRERLFGSINRSVLDVDVDDPFVRKGATQESIFPNLDSELTLDQTTLSIPSIDLPPECHYTSTDVLNHSFRHFQISPTEIRRVKWDEKRGRYRLRSSRDPAPQAQEAGSSRGARNEDALLMVLEVGSAAARIERWIKEEQGTKQRRTSPTHHALAYAVSTLLTYTLGTVMQSTRKTSMKDIEAAVDGLTATCSLIGWPLEADGATSRSLPDTSSALLSHIFSHLKSLDLRSKPSPSTMAIAYMFQHATGPYLSLIAAWLGLQPDTIDYDDGPISSDPWVDLGIVRSIRTVAGQEKYEYDFHPSTLPSFITPELGRKVYEGGRSLRLLKEASPGHPACAEWGVALHWRWSLDDISDEVHDHIARVKKDTDSWRRSIRAQPSSHSLTAASRGSGTKQRKQLLLNLYDRPASSTGRQTPISPSVIPEAPSEVDGRATHLSVPRAFAALAPLAELSRLPLLGKDALDLPTYITERVFALPLAHARIVNRSLVSLFLEELQYTAHIDILRAYWLGGDAAFSERVASALFGMGRGDDSVDEAGMGRRARTRARMGLGIPDAGGRSALHDRRENDDIEKVDHEDEVGSQAPEREWGIALGVGLSDRSRWPPGGSELAYALRTTLVDADVSVSANASVVEKEVWGKVEDTISFAIRPLPKNDGELKAKWKDPQTVEALDFLFLAYSPPPTLHTVLPRDVLDKYQIIHTFLLRLSRAQIVLRGMYADLERREGGLSVDDRDILRSIKDLRIRMTHFVETTTRYVMDTAIGANFGKMQARLSELRWGPKGPSSRDVALGLGPCSPLGGARQDDEGGASAEDADLSVFAFEKGDHDAEGVEEEGAGEGERDAEEEEEDVPAHQLESVHSLVTYHRLTLERIMRSCLLAEGGAFEAAHGILMDLLQMVLDAGKAVRSYSRGWKVEVELERVREMLPVWKGREEHFIQLIHLIAKRASNVSDKSGNKDAPDAEGEDGTDMRMLLEMEDGEIGTSFSSLEVNLREWIVRLDLYRGMERPTGTVQEAE